MKILFVQDSLGTGGAEKSNSQLWYFLKEKKIIFKIVVLRHRKLGIENEILKEGFDVVFLSPGTLFSHSRKIAEIISNFQPNLVHSVLFKASLRVRFAKLFCNFYHLESLVNCLYSPTRLKDPKVNLLKLNGYRLLDMVTSLLWTDHFHANGKTVASHYHRKLFLPLSRISIIPRGRKPNDFVNNISLRTELRKELGAGGKILIINVARQEYQKAQEVILEAIHNLQEIQKRIMFILVGRKGNRSKFIQSKIENYNLSGCVKLLGHRNDVYRLLAASDIFIFPSRFEGLPGVLIEAEAAGLPIICSDIPNNKEVVIVGKNAIICPLDNVESFTIALKELINNEFLRNRMGEQSQKIFYENFALDQINNEMLNLYKTLCLKTGL